MKNKFAIEPPWTGHRLVMLESPGWRALSKPARMVLDRLEIQLMRNSGRNGALVCTYQDFVDYGIWRSTIANAIRQAVVLGFLELTQRGRRLAGVNCPNHYRLTYLPTAAAAPTNEWRKSKGNGPVAKREDHNFSQDHLDGLGKATRMALRKAINQNSQTPNPSKRKAKNRDSFLETSHLGERRRRSRSRRGRVRP